MGLSVLAVEGGVAVFMDKNAPAAASRDAGREIPQNLRNFSFRARLIGSDR